MIKKTCHLSPSRITVVMLHFTLCYSDNFFSHYPCLFNALNILVCFLIFSVCLSLPGKEGKPITKFLHQAYRWWMQFISLSAFPPNRLQELKWKTSTLAGSAHLLPVGQGASHRRMEFLFDFRIWNFCFFILNNKKKRIFQLIKKIKNKAKVGGAHKPTLIESVKRLRHNEKKIFVLFF